MSNDFKKRLSIVQFNIFVDCPPMDYPPEITYENYKLLREEQKKQRFADIRKCSTLIEEEAIRMIRLMSKEELIKLILENGVESVHLGRYEDAGEKTSE